ncbi:DUF58 domain-containing protein [Colwellia sp. D2M02]|uniref:DUF58 domain-containing protein n=1 Tax=Colwellia asteriadis TaxID=517723 RepID=A0ABN1L7X7_9GAMM|nr:DUF58 domain-containing protein [Colwellia sp. D2M02]MBU2892539.1 DUF58 domain-containing protein [Colwellia sp. D2M02]
MTLKENALTWFTQRANSWLTKRIPAANSHTLSNRNIFILPTPFGIAYLSFVLLLFLLGTNYQNNIILLLSYLLASFFITVMMHSFLNFSKLKITVPVNQQHQLGYAGQPLYFPLIISAVKKHYHVNFQLKSLPPQLNFDDRKASLACCEKGDNSRQLLIIGQQRGEYSLGRVTIYSEYSFGLFKSWSQLDFAQHVTLYPKPKRIVSKQYALLNDKTEQGESISLRGNRGIDDFSELKHFVRGESKARTAWKQLAKGQGHFTKHYQENHGGLLWLKLSDMPAENIETQLSYLTFLVNELTRTEQVFGLQLNSSHSEILPNSGSSHQQRCLQALARF